MNARLYQVSTGGPTIPRGDIHRCEYYPPRRREFDSVRVGGEPEIRDCSRPVAMDLVIAECMRTPGALTADS
jgi:hypothetical protein